MELFVFLLHLFFLVTTGLSRIQQRRIPYAGTGCYLSIKKIKLL